MKPLLVGEANPYQSDPRLAQHFALYPDPPGCAGWRLCKLVMGLEPEDYLARFDRVNLCDGKWGMKEAKEKASSYFTQRVEVARLLGADIKRPIVLFGAKVCRAFNTGFYPFTYTRVYERGDGALIPLTHRLVILPHPSGLSRAWNEPGAFERARGVLREAGVL